MKGIRMELTILRHRRLLWELVKRDLRTRYVGSIMGLFWSVINPLIMLVIYIFVFSLIFQFGKPGAGGIPNFPVYLCCGVLPWNALLEALLGATGVVAASGGLIKRAVFPAAILPMQSIVASFINLLITLALLGVFLLAIGAWPGWVFLMIFPLMLLQFVLIVGPCYFFATVNVFFRDMALLLSAIMNILFWVTPIVYAAKIATTPFPWMGWFFAANPFSHLVRLYRECLYIDRTEFTFELALNGRELPVVASVLYVLAFGLAFYAVGKYVFTRSQSHFVDEV